MSTMREPLREAFNVEDLKRRDGLVRRFQKIRANAVNEKAFVEAWNRSHPNESPLDTTLYDKIVAWVDGTGPMPTTCGGKHCGVCTICRCDSGKKERG